MRNTIEKRRPHNVHRNKHDGLPDGDASLNDPCSAWSMSYSLGGVGYYLRVGFVELVDAVLPSPCYYLLNGSIYIIIVPRHECTSLYGPLVYGNDNGDT